MVTKTIVCLANSRKLQGRCIAGIELVADAPISWIRPVSARPHEEVSEYERQYEDGRDPKVLDVIEVPLSNPKPHDFQEENWLLLPDEYWVQVGNFPTSDLDSLIADPGPLWVNGYDSYNGRNDFVPLDQAVGSTFSLVFIRVETLAINVYKPGKAFGNSKRRVQGQFEFAGVEYRLWITDPSIERSYLAQPDGRHQIGPCYLTVSLGEPLNERCYKLVAAVITPD
jgi:hypothetical protein